MDRFEAEIAIYTEVASVVQLNFQVVKIEFPFDRNHDLRLSIDRSLSNQEVPITVEHFVRFFSWQITVVVPRLFDDLPLLCFVHSSVLLLVCAQEIHTSQPNQPHFTLCTTSLVNTIMKTISSAHLAAKQSGLQALHHGKPCRTCHQYCMDTRY